MISKFSLLHETNAQGGFIRSGIPSALYKCVVDLVPGLKPAFRKESMMLPECLMITIPGVWISKKAVTAIYTELIESVNLINKSMPNQGLNFKRNAA